MVGEEDRGRIHREHYTTVVNKNEFSGPAA